MDDKKRFIDTGEAEPPLFLDAPDDIKEEPVDIKNEPIDELTEFKHEDVVCGTPNEIKDEPIDDFSDIKQEEPDADMYCPSTGNSRPLNQNNIVYEGMRREVETTEKEQENRIEDLAKSNQRMRTCDLCLEKTRFYSMSLINDPSRTQQLCSNLIETEHRNKIECFSKHRISRVTICWNHFKSVSEAEKEHSLVKQEMSRVRQINRITENERIQLSRRCDLCGERTSSYTMFPIPDDQLCDNLIEFHHRVLIQRFVTHNISSVTICLKHFKQEPFEAGESANSIGNETVLFESSNEIKEEPVEIKEEPIDNFVDIKQKEPIADMYCPSTGSSRAIVQAHKRKYTTRSCNICGEETNSYYISPIQDQSRVSLLCDKLIEEADRSKVQFCAHHNFPSVIICLKHLKEVPTKIEDDRFRAEKNPIDDGSNHDEDWIEETGPT